MKRCHRDTVAPTGRRSFDDRSDLAQSGLAHLQYQVLPGAAGRIAPWSKCFRNGAGRHQHVVVRDACQRTFESGLQRGEMGLDSLVRMMAMSEPARGADMLLIAGEFEFTGGLQLRPHGIRDDPSVLTYLLANVTNCGARHVMCRWQTTQFYAGCDLRAVFVQPTCNVGRCPTLQISFQQTDRKLATPYTCGYVPRGQPGRFLRSVHLI